MRKNEKIFSFNSRLFLSVLLFVFFISFNTGAAAFFICVDPAGNKAFSDYPVEGLNCENFITDEGSILAADADNTDSGVKSTDDKTTKVIILGNLVLVPVTFVYDRNETKANLVLDTGATGTTIHNNIAERLYINLSKATKARGEVVGGGLIEASMITMSRIKVGPHTFLKRNVFIVPHEYSAVKFDGLLGMDLLREFHYKIDFANEMIIWD
jgi:predicted aspartyl protease